MADVPRGGFCREKNATGMAVSLGGRCPQVPEAQLAAMYHMLPDLPQLGSTGDGGWCSQAPGSRGTSVPHPLLSL